MHLRLFCVLLLCTSPHLTQVAHAEAAARLLPLRTLLTLAGADEAEEPTAAEEATRRLTHEQHDVVKRLRRAVAAWDLGPHLVPLPTPTRVLDDDGYESSARRIRQKRLLALLGVDAAVDAARAAHGGHNACAGMHEWLVRKSSDLGLDITGELVRAALDVDDKTDSDSQSSSSEEQEDDDEEEGPMASEEVFLSGDYARVLVQIELAPLRQRLIFSLLSLNSADLGETSLKYTFAIGLTSAYLLDAESLHEPYFEFAAWRTAERGALCPAEGLPPSASVERRARAFVDFFRCGEGAQPPVAPREMPPADSFAAVEKPVADCVDVG